MFLTHLIVALVLVCAQHKIRDAFRDVDLDKNGEIDLDEFRHVLENFGYHLTEQVGEVTRESSFFSSVCCCSPPLHVVHLLVVWCVPF